MTGVPGTQPAWYTGTGVFLTLPCALDARSGDPDSTGTWPEAGTEREDAGSQPTDLSLPAAVRARLVTPRDLLEGWPDPRLPALPVRCFKLLKGSGGEEAVHRVVRSVVMST